MLCCKITTNFELSLENKDIDRSSDHLW